MDDDELMEEWCQFVLINGSDEAATIVMDADASWADMDLFEVEDLLNGFSDEVGWANVQRLCLMVMAEIG